MFNQHNETKKHEETGEKNTSTNTLTQGGTGNRAQTGSSAEPKNDRHRDTTLLAGTGPPGGL